jgi:outer membrane lipoprotein-sorting protein
MTWRVVIRGAGAVLAAALAAGSAHAGDEGGGAPETWFARMLARNGSQLNVTYFWSKGPMMRAESVIAGQLIVTIVNGDTYYTYSPSGGGGLAVARAPEAIAADADNVRPFGREVEVLMQQGAEKVGEETLRGRPCDVYRVSDATGRRTVWVTQGEPSVTSRIEIFQRATGTTQYLDYDQWVRGIPLADGFFEPHGGLRLKRYELDEYLLEATRDGTLGAIQFLHLLTGRSRQPDGAGASSGSSPR